MNNKYIPVNLILLLILPLASLASCKYEPPSSANITSSETLSLSEPSLSNGSILTSSKEYLKTDPAKPEAYNAAIKAYNEFLSGKISAKNKIAGHTNETVNINEMYNMRYKPGIDSYGLFDVNGDGIPELHTRSHTYNIFSYQNGELEQWYQYGATSSGAPFPLENRAVFAVFTSTGRQYQYTTFGPDGTTTTISFFDGASYDGEDVPENAPYYFNGKQVSKKEFDELTKDYIALSKKPAPVEWYHY